MKEEQLAAEALANARADKLLAQEEVWIRKGVEARRTRSVARIQRLEVLRAQRQARRDSLGQVRLEVDSGAPSGKIVAELRDVCMRFGDEGHRQRLQRHHPARRQGRPDRPERRRQDDAAQADPRRAASRPRHGAPAAPSWRWPTSTRCAARSTWTRRWPTPSARAASGSSSAAQRKHVMSYLNDFLFSPERANSPVRTLSGGERNRVLLARLFALPANVLVLDEPTNDLDIDTLELLEELLQDYAGTVFLVSHDRRFLDNVVTSTIAWEGDECARPVARIRRRLRGLEAAARTRAQQLREQAARARAAPTSRKAAAAAAPRRRAPAAEAAQAQLQGAARTRRTAGAHRGAGSRAEGAGRAAGRPRCLRRRTRSAWPRPQAAMRRSTRSCWRRWSAGRRCRALTA